MVDSFSGAADGLLNNTVFALIQLARQVEFLIWFFMY